MIVVDASVLVAALTDDGAQGARCRVALAAQTLAAPEILDVEVLSALRRLVRDGTLAQGRARRALRDLCRAGIARSSHRPLLTRMWELRDNLSAYDASYVTLAEHIGAPLVTADRALASAPGVRCEIELVR